MKQLLKKLSSYFPTSIPAGMTEFDAYVADIVSLVGPIATPDDIEWVVDAEMMRIAPTRSKLPKNEFVKTVRVAAAKQLAGARFQALKLKHEAQQKAAQEAAAAQAALAPSAETPSEVALNEIETPKE